MNLRCIRPHSQYKPGDTETVPDGAAFDSFHWEPAATPEDPPAAAPVPAAPQFPSPVKEM